MTDDDVTDAAVEAIVANGRTCPACERPLSHADLRPHARWCDHLRADVTEMRREVADA